MLLTNCPNCGGILLDSGVCPYCQTKVRYENELNISVNEPIEILIKHKSIDSNGNEVTHLIPFKGWMKQITKTYNTVDIYADGTRYPFPTSPQINLEIEGYISK